MAWLRGGDTAYSDHRVLELQDHDNWAMGLAAYAFLMHLAGLCAKDGTYDVAPAYIRTVGGPITADLLKRVEKSGLMFSTGKGKAKRWRIVDDAPEILHIRTREEIEKEKRDRADTGDPWLRAAVLLRDGDQCRWCGRIVQPHDTRSASGRGRELDHLRRPAATADDLVVSCKVCNGARGRAWQDPETRPLMDQMFTLRPVPTTRVFVASTAAWLDSEGYTLPAGAMVTGHASKDPRPHQADDQTHPPTQDGVATVTSTTPSTDQPPATQVGVAASNGPARSAHPDTQRAATPPTPPTSTPHPDTQPEVAPPADAPPQQPPATSRATRPTALQPTGHPPVTHGSGGAGPGRVGFGTGTGRVAGPPSRLPPDPPRPDSTTTPPTAPRSRRGRRRRSRPGGDQR